MLFNLLYFIPRMFWTKTLFPHSGIQKGISTHFVGALISKVDHNNVRLRLPSDSYAEIRFVPPPVGIFPNLSNLPTPRGKAGGLPAKWKACTGPRGLADADRTPCHETYYILCREVPTTKCVTVVLIYREFVTSDVRHLQIFSPGVAHCLA